MNLTYKSFLKKMLFKIGEEIRLLNMKAGYKLGAFIENKENYLAFKESLERDDLNTFFEDYQPNISVDLVEVFAIIDQKKGCFILTVSNPYELFEGEKLIEAIQFDETKLSGLSIEEIFSV